MAINLGSLYVELKANTGAFIDGLSKAAVNSRAFGRDVEGSLSKIGSLFAPLGEAGQKLAAIFDTVGSASRSALTDIGKSGALVGGLTALTGGAAALGGAMFALAERASDVGAKIYEASEKTGIGAAQLSGLMALCKETGGDFDSLTTSLARAGANLQKAIIDPGSAAGRVLSQVLGGAKNLADEGLKPMGDRILDVVKHIFAMNNAGERNVALTDLLGRGWMNNIGALKLLAEQGYGPAIAQAQKFGYYFTDASAKQMKQFQETLVDMKGAITGIGLAIGQSAVPGIQKWIEGIHSLFPYIEAWYDRAVAIGALMDGQIGAARNYWNAAAKAIAGADEYQNNFLVHIHDLTEGQKKSAETGDVLNKGVKAYADALANLISREKEEIALLGTNGDQAARLGVEYRHTVDEINKLVAAGGSYKESVIAQALALDIFRKKLFGLKPIVPQVPELQEPNAPPELRMPQALPPGLVGPAPALVSQTLSQLALLSRAMETTRTAEHAMRLEADLSSTAFAKLAKIFPNLTEAEAAALPAGQKLIEMFAKMDKRDAFASFGDQLKEMTNKMVADGENFSRNLVAVMGKSFEGLEDRLTELVVKGRTNFRDLGRAMEEGLVKASLQKGASMLLSGSIFGQKLSGKADGSRSAPFYVVLANEGHQLIGGITGQGIAKPGEYAPPNLGQIGNLAGKLFDQFGLGSGFVNSMNAANTSPTSGAMAPLLKGLGSFLNIFKGFLAAGGDVTPGRAYMVGERHPEFFLPRQPGAVVPALGAAQMRSVTYVQHYHITTPDPDNFRRTQSQILAEGYRGMARAHARNS